MSSIPVTIEVGKTTFRATMADGNPLWRVTKKRGGNTFECTVEDSEPDFGGHTRVFGGEEISGAVRVAAMWDHMRSNQGDFYASLQPGQIVHYNNGFAQFVRCEVVLHEGQNQLKPIALVGAWKNYELPGWQESGAYRDGGSHVRWIAEGKLWQPADGCVFEAPGYSKQYLRDGDPRDLPAHNLAKPAPTPAQAQAAELLAIVNAVREAVASAASPTNNDWSSHYAAQIAAVRRVIQ